MLRAKSAGGKSGRRKEFCPMEGADTKEGAGIVSVSNDIDSGDN